MSSVKLKVCRYSYYRTAVQEMYKKIRIITESPLDVIVPDSDILPASLYLLKNQSNYSKLLIIIHSSPS